MSRVNREQPTQAASLAGRVSALFALRNFTQERIVLTIAIALFVACALFLDGFFTAKNLLVLFRNVAVLCILGVAMAIVVIGRGIDLSLIAVMAISAGWTLKLIGEGVPIEMAVLCGLLGALIVGIINGLLIAFVEIPALFATLATGIFVYGFGKSVLLQLDIVFMPQTSGWLISMGQGMLGIIPISIVVALLVIAVFYALLKRTKFGRFIYATGDNPLAARITGIPVRLIYTAQYGLASMIGFVAGILVSTSVEAMNTRVVNSTMIYDVILVVVLGGIGLSGGKGGIRNVLVGTLLIGILLNSMTIMNMQYTQQNLIKSVILLAAIIIDSILHPRNEETAQQGDI